MLITITVITIITNSHEASIHGFWRKKKYKKQFINSKLHKKVRWKYLRKKNFNDALASTAKSINLYSKRVMTRASVCISWGMCAKYKEGRGSGGSTSDAK